MSDILTPNFGESVTSATVAAWHKNAGDPVAKGDTLVTLETDKVSTDLEADESGVLEILVPEGAEAPIGAVLGRISPLDGSSAAPPSVPLETREKPASGPSSPVTGAPEQKPEKKTSSPDQTTSGKNGKTGKEASPRFIRKPMSPLRRTIAARLVEAQHQAAILTTFNECDMSSVMELRKQFHAEFRERHGTKLGFMSFFIKAVVKALQEVPQVNARIDGADIVENLYYDISVAIGTDKGLVVPSPRFIRKPMSPLRRTIAARLVEAQHQAAILTTFNECDMSSVMELRKQFHAEFRERHGTKLGFMSFFIKAVVKALQEVPQVNARIDGADIVENLYYDISVAIGTDKGLVVPVLRDCDRKTFPELEQELAVLAEKARSGNLSMQDLQGGCFSISNGGTYGSLLSTPILNPPQSGILGMHAIQERPVVRDGQIVVRPMMYLALSYDHRLVDGKQAVQFLVAVKNAVENPVFEL